MAEISAVEALRTTVPCRFYAHGVCREGDQCKYLHEGGCSTISTDEQTKDVVKDKPSHISCCSKTQAGPEGCSSTSNSRANHHIVSSGTDGVRTDDGRTEGAITSCSNSISTLMIGTCISETSASDNPVSNSPGSQAYTEPVVCHFYQQGRCMFGNNCRNRHTLENSANSSSVSQSEGLSTSSPNKISIPVSSLPELPQSGSSSVSCSTLSTHSSEDGSETSCDERLEGRGLKTTLRVNAPEFIPSGIAFSVQAEISSDEIDDDKEASSGKTWAQVVNATAGNGVPSPNMSLCPYAEAGECPYAERCSYLHGDTCEFCGHACLHPANEEQRKAHTDDCIKNHEREMELAFAVARSRDKQCGVCFEVVVDKNPASEQRFGILPNCNHCFCLACIRKWRQAKQFENKIIRACPECRVTSDFVCPSMYWVDTKEEKDKLILAYKDALSNKQCKYFKQGRGKCPFGNKCFYLHAYPDGTKVDTGPPIRRHRQNADGDTDVLQLFLWDFLDERDSRWLYNLDDLELMSFLSGSDDSDSSEIEMY